MVWKRASGRASVSDMQNGNKRYGTARPRVFQAENKVFPKKGTSCTFFPKFFTAIPSRTKNEHIRILRWPLPSFCCASYAFGKKEERMELLSRRRLGLPNRRETCV